MSETPSGVVRSLVPARMDRLPWAPFHSRLVIALGVAWVLDGLEITIASLVGPVLQSEHTLHLSSIDVGRSASVYLVGEVAGALFFGYLSDRLGRRRLFIATLGLYLIANALTAFAFTYAVFVFFRFFAGAGIGGEYAAINSAIDELIPAKYRGHTDLAINGTYWLGALIGALGEYVLLNPRILPIDLGWRIGLFVGPLIGVLIWRLRGASACSLLALRPLTRRGRRRARGLSGSRAAAPAPAAPAAAPAPRRVVAGSLSGAAADDAAPHPLLWSTNRSANRQNPRQTV